MSNTEVPDCTCTYLHHFIIDSFLAYRCVHDARPVGPDGVGNVTDVNSVEMFVVRCTLNKDLAR